MNKNKPVILFCLILLILFSLPADAKPRKKDKCPMLTSFISRLHKTYLLDIELVGGRKETFQLNIKSADSMTGIFTYSLVDVNANDTLGNLGDGVGTVNYENYYFNVPILSGTSGEILSSFYCNVVLSDLEAAEGVFNIGTCSTISRLNSVLLYVPAMATLQVVN